VFPTAEWGAVRSLALLFDALATPEGGLAVGPGDADAYLPRVHLLWTFALVWSLGATLTEDRRGRRGRRPAPSVGGRGRGGRHQHLTTESSFIGE